MHNYIPDTGRDWRRGFPAIYLGIILLLFKLQYGTRCPNDDNVPWIIKTRDDDVPLSHMGKNRWEGDACNDYKALLQPPAVLIRRKDKFTVAAQNGDTKTQLAALQIYQTLKICPKDRLTTLPVRDSYPICCGAFYETEKKDERSVLSFQNSDLLNRVMTYWRSSFCRMWRIFHSQGKQFQYYSLPSLRGTRSRKRGET